MLPATIVAKRAMMEKYGLPHAITMSEKENSD